MRVLQVLPSLAAGGAEGFVTNLGVALSRLGVHVTFYLLGGARGGRGVALFQRLSEAGIEVKGGKERYPGSAANVVQLAFLLRSWRPHIVQANLYPAEVAIAGARFLAPRKSCYFRRLANTDFLGYRSVRVVRLMDRFYPHVIACSQATADAYRAFMNMKEKSRLTVIQNGGCLPKRPPTRQQKLEARRSLDIPEKAFVIAHIGCMSVGGRVKDGGVATSQKAHDVLLKSFSRAVENVPESILLLLGDGPLRQDVESLAVHNGIRDKVHFLGQRREPWPTLKAADMFCFPSRYEGLPNVLLEAASAGLPIVASDIPEIRELSAGTPWILQSVDDVDGFASAVQKVHHELDELKRRARRATACFSNHFSIEECAKKYLRVYEQAIEG